MADPVTFLTQRTHFLDWTGSKYNIYMVFVWTEVETSPCHYDVEVRRVSDGGWQDVQTVDNGVRFLKIHVGNTGPSDNWVFHQFFDRVRVTCITEPDDLDHGVTELNINFHTGRNLDQLTNRELHNGGMQGGKLYMTITGIDTSFYIYCANLHVYNMTQNQREIYHRSLSEGNAALAINYCDHHQPVIGFLLDDPDIPREGDRIQVHYTAIVGNGKNPGALNAANDGIESIWTTTFSGPVNFPSLSLSGTQGNAFSYFVADAPGITGESHSATYSKTSGSYPPGITMNSSGALSGTPTTMGTYTFHVQTVSVMGDIGGGNVTIVISASQLPFITGPFSSVTLNQFQAMSFTLVATHNPSSFALSSGTLPTGVTLNTSTGVVSGTPTAIQSATNAGFKATNVTGQGPEFVIAIAVVALPPPAITSASTATAYRGETWNYVITATNSPIAFTASNLPSSAVLNNATGLISGVIDPTLNAPGTRVIVLRAQNQTGYSPNFNLTLTIADRIPIITSDLTVTTNAFQTFTYLITASRYPITFGAAGLPFGLQVDPNSGLITGMPVTPGTFPITLTATNTAGTGTAVLVLIVKLLRPVIDTSITSGKAITCETGIPIQFQPVATNSPTVWVCGPTPEGFTLDGNLPNAARGSTGPNGLLAGTFGTVGLYGIVFECANAAGASDPAIFYFLVELGASGSTVTALGTGVDIWIDIQSGEVTLLSPGQTMEVKTTTTENGTTKETTSKVPVPVSDAVIANKRGDTLPITIWFHKGGRPVQITDLTSLMFGVREDYTSPYAVLTTGYLDNEDGSYTIWPNYSGNAEIDFEIDDEEEFLELLAEVQWETGTEDPMDERVFTRRSSQTFRNRIYRDVIRPDDPNLAP